MGHPFPDGTPRNRHRIDFRPTLDRVTDSVLYLHQGTQIHPRLRRFVKKTRENLDPNLK